MRTRRSRDLPDGEEMRGPGRSRRRTRTRWRPRHGGTEGPRRQDARLAYLARLRGGARVISHQLFRSSDHALDFAHHGSARSPHRVFDLAEFDALTVNLYLVVATTLQNALSVVTYSDDVTGAI